METETRSNRVIKATINESIGTIEFDVLNAGTVTFHAERVSKQNRSYAEFHGWKQRLVDDAAGEKTPAGKLAAIRGLVDFYEKGGTDWNQKRTARELTVEEKMALYEKLKAELGIG